MLTVEISTFSSIIFKSGKTFKKHKEVRSILHRDYIRTGNIDVKLGKLYDWLFDNRQKADYRPLMDRLMVVFFPLLIGISAMAGYSSFGFGAGMYQFLAALFR